MGVAANVLAVVVACVLLYQGCNGATTLKNDNGSYSVQFIRRDWPSSPFTNGRNLTNHERLRRAMERSNSRVRRLQSLVKAEAGSIYSSPVSAGDGEFIMQIGVGQPHPQIRHVILDTGSDLIWTQCNPCTLCEEEDDNLYNPKNSSTYHVLTCPNDKCNEDLAGDCDLESGICRYLYGYGDLSSTSGDMAFETFSVKRTPSSTWLPLPLSRIQFGCGHTQEGSFNGADGIVGMGRGQISLPSQMGTFINNKFSYCLGPIDDSSGTSDLFLGEATSSHGAAKFSTTPLLESDTPMFSPTFYYLSLEGMSVGGKAIEYPQSTFSIVSSGGGGLIIDSGTTLTYLPDPAYEPLVSAVKSSIKATPADGGLTDLCYESILSMRDIPNIAFHFAGNATFVVPPRNSFVVAEDNEGRELLCMAFMSAGGAGSMSIFGNIQQQNYNMVYDLGKNSLSFAPATCDK